MGLFKLGGVMLGIAVIIVIGQYIIHEFSYDSFQPNASRKFLLQEKNWLGDYHFTNNTPYALKQHIKGSYPGIESIVSILKVDNQGFVKFPEGFVKSGINQNQMAFVENDFFDFFSYNFLEGQANRFQDFSSPGVISSGVAKKLFPDKDALGKTIQVLIENTLIDFTIIGIIDDPPSNTNFNFEWIGSLDHLNTVLGKEDYLTNLEYEVENYIHFSDKADTEAIMDRVEDYYSTITLDNSMNTGELRLESIQTLNLTPVAKNRLLILGSLALLVLAISLVNYVLLSVAKGIQDLNNLVLERISGARAYETLIRNFISSALHIFIASSFALLLILIIEPYIPRLFPFSFTTGYNLLQLILLLLILGLLSAFAIGGLKTYIISSYTPIDILHNRFKSGKTGSIIRNSLLAFQLLAFIALVSTSFLMHKQMKHIHNTDIGFDKDYLISMKLNNNDARLFPVYKQELLKIAGVQAVSGTNCPPLVNHRSIYGYVDVDSLGNQSLKQTEYIFVDNDYFSTMGMTLKLGQGMEQYEEGFCVVNEALVAEKGITDPIGSIVEFGGNNYTISGVLQDFHQHSLHEKINPFVVYLDTDAVTYVLIRMDPADIQNTLTEIKGITDKLLPQTPFDYNFMDDSIARQYVDEKKAGKLIILLAVLSMVISCIGLLGLSLLETQKRTKEIGIRKVNGAKIIDILTMLNMDIIKLVAISFIIASPIAWFAMSRWLQNFAYKTELSWWVFAIAGMLALTVSILTVSLQSWHTARKNAVEALRYE
jgi:putative ABC transport system permease protein